MEKELKMGDIVEIKSNENWEDIIFIKYGEDGSMIGVLKGHEKNFREGLCFGLLRWSREDWRSKPEPKYSPYSYKDAEELLGMKIKNIDTGSYYIIDAVCKEDFSMMGVSMHYDVLLRAYMKLDGSPCGKLEER